MLALHSASLLACLIIRQTYVWPPDAEAPNVYIGFQGSWSRDSILDDIQLRSSPSPSLTLLYPRLTQAECEM
jgi:hypothetical protein